MNRFNTSIKLAALVIAQWVSFHAFAEVKLDTEAFKIEYKQQGESQLEQWVAPENVVPGDMVGYRINFVNTGDKPAENIELKNPVPDNTIYIEGSAVGEGTAIDFSIDGGKSFGKPNELKIKEGDQERIALATEYTHVRWVLKSSLKQNEQRTVSYKVRIK